MRSDTIIIGRGQQITMVPRKEWEQEIAAVPQHFKAKLSFMTADHHRVRNFVVRELPLAGEPLSIAHIARQVHLPASRVTEILDDLEHHLTFLYRNPQGMVAWAYPVTVDRTPHHLTFSTGERLYGAGAEDAIATPFVQGRLRATALSVSITSECAHCASPLHIDVTSELHYHVERDIAPLVFLPFVDFDSLTDPSIIDAYGRHCVFFCSEEHARVHRSKVGKPDGEYLTLEQSAYVTRIVQGALFAFEDGTRHNSVNAQVENWCMNCRSGGDLGGERHAGSL